MVSDFGLPPPAFRLPDDTRLGPVSLQVADLDRSLTFYERVLGLRVLTPEGNDAALGAQGDERVLVRLRARRGARPVPRGGVLGLFHFAILLPDRASLGRLLCHLDSLGVVPGLADHAVSEAIYLNDPDGLGIEVYADRPRHAWRHVDRQLFMTTEPLDVESVMRSGGEIAWSGMPAGTVIGHVHLHVGNLIEAASFYHATLGLDKTVWDYPGALFMSAGGYHHHLGTNTWASGPPAAGDQARLLAWELVIPLQRQALEAVRSIEAAGHTVREADGGWMAEDPWGTPLRIVTDDA